MYLHVHFLVGRIVLFIRKSAIASKAHNYEIFRKFCGEITVKVYECTFIKVQYAMLVN